MADFVNTLSWSPSRSRTFKTCKRRYYLQYYAKWNGWFRDSPPEAQLAYRLSKMTSLAMLAGTAVHEMIKRILSARLWGHPPIQAPSRIARKDILTPVWADAEGERWRQNPKRFPPVFELYYGPIPEAAELKKVGAKITRTLDTFLSSPLFEELERSDPTEWLTVDPGPNAGLEQPVVDGVALWAIPDFARRMEDGRCEVWDWKTGRPGTADEVQLLAYGLYAHQIWGFDPEDIQLSAFYLDPEKADERLIVPFTFNQAQLGRVTRIIQEDIDAMRDLLIDPEQGEAKPVEAFPMTDVQKHCTRCSFKEICAR